MIFEDNQGNLKFYLFLHKNLCCGFSLDLMSTHNICFNEELTKIIFQLSSNIIKYTPGPEVIKLFSFSTKLSMKFILLINVKMPTIVGILTFISRINDRIL